MSRIVIYGIKNCDTMKKAFGWFDKHKVAYTFHDYKKQGADPEVLKRAIAEHGWETVINRKGTTWRALPKKVREAMTEKTALTVALENPSLVKRPLIAANSITYIGFNEIIYKDIIRLIGVPN